MRPSTEPTAIARTVSWVVSSGALGSSGIIDKGYVARSIITGSAVRWLVLVIGVGRLLVVDWELLLLLWSRVQVDLSTAGSHGDDEERTLSGP